MAQVHVSRFLDAGVMSMFLVFLSGTCLYMLSQLWTMAQSPALASWNIGRIMRSILPFSKRFEFNLSHILLFAIIICLMSLRSTERESPSRQHESDTSKVKRSSDRSSSPTPS